MISTAYQSGRGMQSRTFPAARQFQLSRSPCLASVPRHKIGLQTRPQDRLAALRASRRPLRHAGTRAEPTAVGPWDWSPARDGSSAAGQEQDSDGGFLAYYSSGSESSSSGSEGEADSWLETAVAAAEALQRGTAGPSSPSAPGTASTVNTSTEWVPQGPQKEHGELWEAAVAVRDALCAAGCHDEMAEELVRARPGLLLLDVAGQVRPNLEAVGATAAGFPADDITDVFVRYHRNTAELLCEGAAWPCALARSTTAFRTGLGLLLQLVAAARGAPSGGSAGGGGGGASEQSRSGSNPHASTSADTRSRPPGRRIGSTRGGASSSDGSDGGDAGAGARSAPASPPPSTHVSARDVLLDLSAAHAGQLLCAGCGRAVAAADALQAYLGWPPQLAARALLGCPISAPAHALLGAAVADEVTRKCGSELMAEAARQAQSGGEGGAAGTSFGGTKRKSPFAPASLVTATPAHLAQLAAWLGHLGFDRKSTALLTSAAQQDWAAVRLADVQVAARSWAEAAGLPYDGAAVALWLAGEPVGSPLASHCGRLVAQGVDREQRRQLAIGALCSALPPQRA